MKNFKFIFILFLLFSMSCKSYEKKQWGEWELYGNIKSIVQISYSAQKESINGQQIDSVYFLFNEKGENIEFIRSWSSQYARSTSEYDMDGNLIVHISFDKNGNQGDTRKYLFESGNCTQYDFYSKQNDHTTTSVYRHDDNGNMIEQFDYSGDRAIIHRPVYSYDTNNNFIEKNGFDREEKLSNKTIYKYENEGILSEDEYINYDEVGDIMYKTIIKYNKDEKVIKISEYDSEENLESSNVFSYDEKGQKIKVVKLSGDGKENSSITYKYDENGNPIEKIFDYHYSLQKITFTYELDNHKNWTKQNEFKDGKIEYIRERKIEYL